MREFTYENYPVQMRLVRSSFPEDRETFDNKLRFFEHCLRRNIHTPPILAAFVDGATVPIASKPLKLPETDIFVKDVTGKRGRGADKYRFREGGYVRNRDTYRAGDLIRLMEDRSCGGGAILIQRVASNHDSWQRFTSGALSTCGVLTARSPGGEDTFVLAATLRMPVGHIDTDNTTLGSIASPIEIQTGRLGPGIRKTPYRGCFRFNAHPDTGQAVTGTVLPYWRELVDFAVRVHNTFDTIFVGWDIALTDEGFSVIEGNIGWSVRVVESPQGRPLKDTGFPDLFDAWRHRVSVRDGSTTEH